MGYFKGLITSWSVSLEAFKMYYVMRASAPSLHRESTDSLIHTCIYMPQYCVSKLTNRVFMRRVIETLE